jgi:hypothetical protein
LKGEGGVKFSFCLLGSVFIGVGGMWERVAMAATTYSSQPASETSIADAILSGQRACQGQALRVASALRFASEKIFLGKFFPRKP